MIIENVPIEKINPAQYNPRKDLKPGDPEYETIKKSIDEFGFVEPLVWNRKTGNLVGGHQRFKILKDRGDKTVPVSVIDMDTTKEKALNIALNKISGVWDKGALQNILLELKAMDFDLSKIGFSADDLLEQFGFGNELTQGNGDPNDAPKVPKKTDIKKGDVYKLGAHELMCGDSADIRQVERFMGPDRADMVFTDPPYGVAIGDKNKFLNTFQKAGRNLENIEGDKLNAGDLKKTLIAVFMNIREIMKDTACIYVTAPQGGDLGLMMLEMMREAGLPVRHVLNWVKNSPTFSMGRLDYEYQHEPIFYTWKKTHKHYGLGQFNTSVWYVDKPRKSKEHPTMKPVELMLNAILNSTKPGQIVADFFGGSGSTLIACQQSNRKCRTMEIESLYCQVIIDRWESFTGKKAKKI
jgi:DNA modification methylase